MTPKLVIAALVFVVLSFKAHGQTDSERALAGKAIVSGKCSRCHAIGLEGSSPHPQAPPFRDVVRRYKPSDLSEALAEGIVSGHPDMPVFVFQPREIAAIVGYLDSLVVEKRLGPRR